MSFLEDIKPLVTGPVARFLAAWIELVVFSLVLPAGFSIINIIAFGLAFFLIIIDVTLAFRRRKHRNAALVQNQAYIFQPKVWVIVLDFIFAFLFTVIWILQMIGFSYYSFSRYRYGYFGVFSSYSMVGFLAIAHAHWFLGAIECHLLRQLKKKGTMIPTSYESSSAKHGAAVNTIQA